MPKMHSRLVLVLSVRCPLCGWVVECTQTQYNARAGSYCPSDAYDCGGHLLIEAEQQRQVLTE